MEIIKTFADIGEFFDMPVKTYSTGMYMRLAFSLAVHVDADIIVIDEILAVGDGVFEKKCINKIWDLRRRGATILYCSHSLYTVASFCDRVVWLKEGKLQAIDNTKKVISMYEDYLREKERSVAEQNLELITPAKKMAEIKKIDIASNSKIVESSVECFSDLTATLNFEIHENTKVYVGFAIDRNDGLCCFADTMLKRALPPFHGPGEVSISLKFRKLPLLGGQYKIVFFLLDDTGICIFDKGETHFFRINTNDKEWGVCYLDYEWEE